MIHLYMLLLYASLYLDVLCMTEVCEMQCFSVVVCLMGIDAHVGHVSVCLDRGNNTSLLAYFSSNTSIS